MGQAPPHSPIATARRLRTRVDAPAAVLALAAILAVFAADMQARNRRLAEYPHVAGRIEETWTQPGGRGGRYAIVTFAAPAEGGAILCRVVGLKIGPATSAAAPGETIDLVPQPGSCASPELGGAPASGFLIALAYVLAVLAAALSIGSFAFARARAAAGSGGKPGRRRTPARSVAPPAPER
jgi:hypothetical protein